jgi:hypothetical protein
MTSVVSANPMYWVFCGTCLMPMLTPATKFIFQLMRQVMTTTYIFPSSRMKHIILSAILFAAMVGSASAFPSSEPGLDMASRYIQWRNPVDISLIRRSGRPTPVEIRPMLCPSTEFITHPQSRTATPPTGPESNRLSYRQSFRIPYVLQVWAAHHRADIFPLVSSNISDNIPY